MKSRHFLMAFLFVFCQPIYADMTGAGDMKIIAELQAMYAQMVETLQEAKAQSESLTNVKSTLNSVVETTDEIRNFSIDSIINRVTRDIDDLTEFDNMDGMSNEQKIRVLQRELKRRVADPKTTDAEADKYKKQLDTLSDIEKRNELLNLINENAVSNLKETGKDLSQRDSSRITAESLATLTQIEVQREMRANQERIDRLNDAKALTDINNQALKIYKNTAEDGW